MTAKSQVHSLIIAYQEVISKKKRFLQREYTRLDLNYSLLSSLPSLLMLRGWRIRAALGRDGALNESKLLDRCGRVRQRRNSSSTTNSTSETKVDDRWPLSLRIAGYSAVGISVPSIFLFAIRHDWETREFVERWIPHYGKQFVDFLRSREEHGIFEGEDSQKRSECAALQELHEHNVQEITLYLTNGDRVTLSDVDPHTCISDIQQDADIDDYRFSDIQQGSAADGGSSSAPGESDTEYGDSNHDSSTKSPVPVEVVLGQGISWWQLGRIALARGNIHEANVPILFTPPPSGQPNDLTKKRGRFGLGRT